ncbi:hypothetical protein [Vibrio chagasii]|uniref:hypothetical protein n=1 Tax=Vibrio chagasii TaxID=170679 RepID=UPI003DA15FE3
MAKQQSLSLAQCQMRDVWMTNDKEQRKLVTKVWRYFIDAGLLARSGYMEVPNGSVYSWSDVLAYYEELTNDSN